MVHSQADAINDDPIVFAVNFDGENKLISIWSNDSYTNLLNQVRSKWSQLESGTFSFSCSVGSFSNCCLESENDFKNIFVICNHSSSKIVIANLCNKLPLPSLSLDNLLALDTTVAQTPCPLNVCSSNPSICTNGEMLEFTGELSLPCYDVCPPLAKNSYLSDHWAKFMDGGVGSVFMGGCNEFRDKIRKYATKLGFRFKFKRNTHKYIYVVCCESSKGGCTWFIRAKLIIASGYFVIYKANFTHKCVGKLLNDKSKRLSPKIIGKLMMEDVKSKKDIVGKDVVLSLRTKYGVEVPYYKAWRAVEFAKDQIFGSFDESYDHLRWYCKALEHTNPGSVVALERCPNTDRFERVFIAVNACVSGFQSCRPMLFLDGTFLKGRAIGTLLSATAKDGNNGLFPVAFALVSAENTSNWEWFIRKIKDNVRHPKEIYYISDKNAGILSAMNAVFERPMHFYCLFHLLTNLKGHFSTGWTNNQRADLGDLFKACAYAPELRIFNQKVQLFKRVGGAIADEWLSQIPFEKWVIAHSPHITRYGEMTSNAAESFNSWILEARSLPVTKMVDWIRQNIARWFVERREASHKWVTALVPQKQEDWDVMYDTGRSWLVRISPGGQYEVHCDLSCTVDLIHRSCSCHQWKVTGFPCAHAVAVIERNVDSVYTYVDECFYTSSYIQSYKGDINPVPATIQFEMETKCEKQKVLPPILKRKPGRPKKLRIPSHGEYPKKKQPLCGFCGRRGKHDSTCIKACRITTEPYNPSGLKL